MSNDPITSRFNAEEIVATIFDRADINIDRLRYRDKLSIYFHTRQYSGYLHVEHPPLIASYRALFSQGMDTESLEVLRDAQIETLANEFGIGLFYPMGRVDSKRRMGIPAHFQYRAAKQGFEDEYRDELTHWVGAYIKLNPKLFQRSPVFAAVSPK